jgi:hypothetical protein
MDRFIPITDVKDKSLRIHGVVMISFSGTGEFYFGKAVNIRQYIDDLSSALHTNSSKSKILLGAYLKSKEISFSYFTTMRYETAALAVKELVELHKGNDKCLNNHIAKSIGAPTKEKVIISIPMKKNIEVIYEGLRHQRPVIVDGKRFQSVGKAAEYYKMSQPGVTNCLQNPNFPNWNYEDIAAPEMREVVLVKGSKTKELRKPTKEQLKLLKKV